MNDKLSPPKNIPLMSITLLLGLLLAAIPWPLQSTMLLNPQWVFIFILYWLMRGCLFPLWLLWTLGLIVDALTHAPLGSHALAHVLMGTLIASIQPRLFNFSFLQRSLIVIGLLAIQPLISAGLAMQQGYTLSLGWTLYPWLSNILAAALTWLVFL